MTSTTSCCGWPVATNTGALNYDYTNICVGGTVTAPHLTTNVVFAPVQTCTLWQDSCNNTNWETLGTCSYSTGPLYWDPPIPTNFPTCGFYYFYPKVDGHPSWSGCPTTTTNVGPNGQVDPFQVTVVQAQVDAVDYGSDYTAFYDYNLDFAGDGTTTFSRPVWQCSPSVNNPVIQPQGQQVGLYVYINVCPAGLGYSLIGTSSEAGLCFTNASVWASGGEDHVSVQAGVALRTNMVDMVSATIDWFVLPTGASNWCSAGTSGPHTNYVTWGWPSTYPKNTATLIRIDKVCNVAKGASSEAAIGDKIGPQATSRDLFYTNSIFSNLTNAWQVLDGQHGDCGTLSTLMKQELDLLGATDSAVKYVYACSTNSGWSPLVGDQPSFDLMVHRVPGDDNTRLGFISGGWNNYEGCCLFQGKYWMGGAGDYKTNAALVLHRWADPNDSPTSSRQCYLDQTNQFVRSPPPPEPTY